MDGVRREREVARLALEQVVRHVGQGGGRDERHEAQRQHRVNAIRPRVHGAPHTRHASDLVNPCDSQENEPPKPGAAAFAADAAPKAVRKGGTPLPLERAETETEEGDRTQ